MDLFEDFEKIASLGRKIISCNGLVMKLFESMQEEDQLKL